MIGRGKRSDPTGGGRRIGVAVTAATDMDKRIFQRSRNPLLLRERLTKQKVLIALPLIFR
jgi:hypothetical protein